mmetsp:Transcript_25480/g.76576  ORF Transcript_25480/g.76576 Transcript_25480/m.76576 type:complete len:375 (-) Transcript_25480:164-1288(-)
MGRAEGDPRPQRRLLANLRPPSDGALHPGDRRGDGYAGDAGRRGAGDGPAAAPRRRAERQAAAAIRGRLPAPAVQALDPGGLDEPQRLLLRHAGAAPRQGHPLAEELLRHGGHLAAGLQAAVQLHALADPEDDPEEVQRVRQGVRAVEGQHVLAAIRSRPWRVGRLNALAVVEGDVLLRRGPHPGRPARRRAPALERRPHRPAPAGGGRPPRHGSDLPHGAGGDAGELLPRVRHDHVQGPGRPPGGHPGRRGHGEGRAGPWALHQGHERHADLEALPLVQDRAAAARLPPPPGRAPARRLAAAGPFHLPAHEQGPGEAAPADGARPGQGDVPVRGCDAHAPGRRPGRVRAPLPERGPRRQDPQVPVRLLRQVLH